MEGNGITLFNYSDSENAWPALKQSQHNAVAKTLTEILSGILCLIQTTPSGSDLLIRNVWLY